MKFYPNRFLNVRFLYAGFYCTRFLSFYLHYLNCENCEFPVWFTTFVLVSIRSRKSEDSSCCSQIMPSCKSLIA